jgi:hypothetical protein
MMASAPNTLKAAGGQLDNFINVFRKEVGRDEYTRSTAQAQVVSFPDQPEEAGA